jgi:tetratricopeptide (TPR) repeat protein
MGEFEKSIDELGELLRADPEASREHAELARLLISCPKASCRDATKGTEHAAKACELTEWKDPETINLLAAAYAAAGNFKQAVRFQEKALVKATTDKQRGAYKRRLETYKRGETNAEEPSE